MNWTEIALFGCLGLATVGVVAWMVTIAVRLRRLERAVFLIVDNTNALRQIVELLRSVDGNTSLLGGIRGVFGGRDRKKSR